MAVWRCKECNHYPVASDCSVCPRCGTSAPAQGCGYFLYQLFGCGVLLLLLAGCAGVAAFLGWFNLDWFKPGKPNPVPPVVVVQQPPGDKPPPGKVDLTGTWAGTIGQKGVGSSMNCTYELTQTGDDVTGKVTVRHPQVPDAHAVKEVRGTVANGIFTFDEPSFIEDRSNVKLKFALLKGRLTLNGNSLGGTWEAAQAAAINGTMQLQKR